MPNLPSSHPEHDPTLIARLAADDLAPNDREAVRARALLTDCPDCAELYADLLAIAAATAALPAPHRTRDFRLTDADAARLRQAGWRGALARLGSPGFAFTRPLATGLATLGIAGLLLATLPTVLLGSAGSASERTLSTVGNSVGGGAYSDQGSTAAPAYAPALSSPGIGTDSNGSGGAPSAAASAAAAPAPSAAPASAAPPVPAASEGTKTGGALSASPEPYATDSTGALPQALSASAAEGGGPSPLVVVSVVLLLAGLGLGGLRLIARRVA